MCTTDSSPIMQTGHPASHYKTCLAIAKSRLAEPNVPYENGRQSHDGNAPIAMECREILEDLALDGEYIPTADGGLRLRRYADGTPA